MGRSMRRMPALLRRFAKLERAAAPATGADPASLRLFFPAWFATELGAAPDGTNAAADAPVAAAAVADVALAISMLVAHEVAEEEDAPPPAPPPADAEPTAEL